MFLDRIKALLEGEQFACSYLAAAAPPLPARLSVLLGEDLRRRERRLEITAAPPAISPDFILPPTAPRPYRCQFRVVLPFALQDGTLTQVGRLLLLLNQFIDLPGFELHELHSRVAYRHVALMHPDSIDQVLIMSIVSAIMMNVSLFSDTIEALVENRVSFYDLLKQLTTAL